MPITKKQELSNVPISKLIPYAKNPRKNDAAVRQVAKSLQEFGLVKNSIVVDEDMVLITGHTTTKAMQSLGWETAPEVTQVFGLTDAQKKAYRIADNKLGETAEWDNELLKLELDELGDMDFDIELTGFDDKQLDEMFPPEVKEVEEDDFEPPTEVKTDIKRGDIFRLGRHRLMCGDCTDLTNVNKLMGGEKADMVFTDPPYNVAGESKNFAADCSTSMNNLKNSEWDKNFDPEKALDIILKNISENATVYICTSHFLAPKIWEWMRTWASHFSWCAWHKSNPMPSLSKRHWTWDGELIPYATRGKHVFNFPQIGHAPSIWCLPKKKETQHPTEKPVGVPAMAISHSSNEGGIIFDPFLGSGTTLIACEQLNRVCYGMEISPQYCQVIIDRWEKLTGQKAEPINHD